MLRKRYTKQVLVALLLLSICPAHSAASVKKRQTRGEQDEDTLTIQLPQDHQQVNLTTTTPGRSKFQIILPSRMTRLREKVDARNTEALPQMSPFLHGGFALLAVGTFVWTEHGYNDLKELALGSVSALALVWLPTLFLQGSLVEIFSLMTLFTQPALRQVFLKELFPRAFETLKKLLLAEVWRRVWPVILSPLPKPFLSPTDEDIMRIRWLPHWVKEGLLVFRDKIDKFTLSKMKSSVENNFRSSFGINDLFIGTDDDTTGPSGGDDTASASNDEPQLVCDGDVCWLE